MESPRSYRHGCVVRNMSTIMLERREEEGGRHRKNENEKERERERQRARETRNRENKDSWTKR